MKSYSLTDYLNYILFRGLGQIIGRLPKGFSLFLGRRLGDFLYYFDNKHKAVTYSNIKTAFGNKLSPFELNSLTHEFYRSFGQSLFEIFFIPFVDEKYISKYISIEGLGFIDEAFKKGKGVILLSVHSGSWELSNIICANLGFPFSLFVRDQRNTLLNELLNLYRRHRGCKIIERQNQLRGLIEELKKNESVGMTVDQGGKTGMLVKFFDKNASMATGAVRLALKYDSVILPAFYARIKGPYIKTIIEPPVEIKRTGDTEKDIQDNLQEIVHIFEKNIEKHAKGYLWSYKIWKYTNDKNILILSDGKSGHLRQAQAVARIISSYLKDKGTNINIETVEIKFSRQVHKVAGGIPPEAGKNRFAKRALLFSGCLAAKFHCRGCLWCLRTFLQKDDYKSLIGKKFDIIISCGSAVSPVNYVLSQENLAKSFVIMRPLVFSTGRFDLVIIPKHDNPPIRKNIVVTEGALNLIDEEYLKEQSDKLITDYGLAISDYRFYIGLLIGGDTKGFHLKEDTMLEVIKQIKSVCERFNADILVTTSRRTQEEVVSLLKEEFKDYPYCKLLVLANEKNIPEAVGGILGMSDFIVSSPESISMISEAVNSKKYVLVFRSRGLSKKHQRFLDYFAKNKYIYLTDSHNLAKKIEHILKNKPRTFTTKDNFLVSEAIGKII